MAQEIINNDNIDSKLLHKKELKKWVKRVEKHTEEAKERMGKVKKDKTRYIPLADRRLVHIMINKDLKELIQKATACGFRHTEIMENAILSCIITTKELDKKGKWTGNYMHTLTSDGFNVSRIINTKPKLSNSFLSSVRKKGADEIEYEQKKKKERLERKLKRLELAKQIEEAFEESPQTEIDELDELEKLKQEINNKIV